MGARRPFSPRRKPPLLACASRADATSLTRFSLSLSRGCFPYDASHAARALIRFPGNDLFRYAMLARNLIAGWRESERSRSSRFVYLTVDPEKRAKNVRAVSSASYVSARFCLFLPRVRREGYYRSTATTYRCNCEMRLIPMAVAIIAR